MKFINIFLKKPIIAHFLFVAVLIFGIIATQTLPVEESPEINLGFAIIVTLYPGAAPLEIERLLTIPIEDAVANVEDIDFINSGSSNGKSVVFVKFLENVKDIDRRVLDLQTEINKIPDLPSKNEMMGPYVFKIATGDTEPIINVMLSSSTITDSYFKELSDNLKRELTSKINGIKDVQIAGVSEEEVEVIVDNEKLLLYNLTIDDIFMALTTSNFRAPGGVLDISGKRYLVKVIGNFDDIDRMDSVLIKKGADGQKLYLGDVTKIHKKFKRGSIQSYLNGKKAVSFYVMRKPESNIVAITKEVQKTVIAFTAQHPEIEVSFKNNQGDAINETISVLKNNAFLGMFLVTILLFLFMGWRASVLAVIGIPFSFLATFFMMKFFGYTINSLSLFAMILVSGMLVDDAIIVIENVYRYREEGLSPYDAVIRGTKEIMWPVISAVITTACAFLPLLMLSGIMGKFLAQLPIIVVLTLIASLFEALIILPVHLYEMKNIYKKDGEKKRAWYEKLLNGYRSFLRKVLRFRYLTLALIFALFLSSIFVATKLRVVLFGDDNTKTVLAKMELSDNTPIEETRKISQEIEKYVLKNMMKKDVSSIVTIVGRVIEDRRWIEKEEVAEFRIDLKEYNPEVMNRVKAALRKKAAKIPSIINFEFMKAANGPPTGRAVDVSVSGTDMKKLEAVGDEIVDYLKTLPGVVDLRGSVIEKVNEITIVPDYKRLEQTGIQLATLADTVRSATSGKYAGRFLNDDGKELRIWIRFDPNISYTLDDLRNLPIKTPSGTFLSVRDVATIKEIQSMARIRRRNRVREIKIGANVDYSVTTPLKINKKLQSKFGDISEKNPGMNIGFHGEFEEQQKANNDVMIAFLIAVLLIYMILGIQFNSFFQPFIVMVTLPFAFIGVAYGLLISGLDLSLLALISLVALAGIVVNDSIILVDFINNVSKDKNRIDALIESGAKRFRPILLTTVTTVGGLLPMAVFATGVNKMWQPMAITMIWGILFATILTLFIIPVLYAIIDDITTFMQRLKKRKSV